MLEDPRFATLVSRNEHEDAVDEAIQAWADRHTVEEVEQAMIEAGVAASRIYTMADIFNDPHYKARDMIVDIPDDVLGKVKVANVAPKLSDTPGVIRRAGGQPGVDTRRVKRKCGVSGKGGGERGEMGGGRLINK